MRLLLTVISIFISGLLTSQSLYENFELEETNFFYKDSANGEFAFGQYEPTDLIKLNDGSLLISTKFSISFPSLHDTNKTYDSTYFAKRDIYDKKNHISSGSVFKLNTNLKKDWEIFFHEKRVVKLFHSNDDRIFVIGETTDMKDFWISEINTTGEILWTESYNYKRQVTIEAASISNNNEIYLLLRGYRMFPIYLRKNPHRKPKFYIMDNPAPNIALMKISIDGKKQWTKAIDNRNKTEKYGHELVISDSLVFVTWSFQILKKNNGKGERTEGKQLALLNNKGKIIEQEEKNNQDIIFFKKELYSITSWSSDTLFSYNGKEKIDSILIDSPDKDIRIGGIIQTKNGHLILSSNHDNNRDYLLISLDDNFKFGEYWTYPRKEYNEIRGAIELDDGSIILIGKCYKVNEVNSRSIISYINIVKLKNGA